jgi:hypothetical protein
VIPLSVHLSLGIHARVALMESIPKKAKRRIAAFSASDDEKSPGGLLFLYRLWDIRPVENQSMNAVLLKRMMEGWSGGSTFAFITSLSEGARLIVGAQAGFVDGLRVVANIAIDPWFPRRLARLSERLTSRQVTCAGKRDPRKSRQAWRLRR